MKRFKPILKWMFAVMAAVSLGACTSAEPDSPDGPDPGIEGEGGEMDMKYSVGNMLIGDLSGTRADGDEAGEEVHPAVSATPFETNVEHVYFIYFDNNGNFVTYQRSTVAAGSTQVRFPVPPTVYNNKKYTVLMVANVDEFFIPNGYNSFTAFLNANTSGKNLGTVKSLLQASVKLTMNTNSVRYLPMIGELVDENGDELKFQYEVHNGRYVLIDGTSNVVNGAIKFTRLVSRIDLNNYAPQAELDIKWVKICNYRDGVYTHDDRTSRLCGSIQPGISDDAPELQGNAYVEMPGFTEVENEDGTTLRSQSLKESLYCFPNYVAKPKQDDAVSTYLMICAQYNHETETVTDGEGNETTVPKLCYYRFNLNPGGDSQLLKRNHIYTANIMGVRGEGASQESTARLSDAPQLNATVDAAWDDDGVTSDADAAGNYLILQTPLITLQGKNDGEYVLANILRPAGVKVTGCTPIEQPGSSNSDFHFEIIQSALGDYQVKVTAIKRNTSNFVKYGYFEIQGVTPENKPLKVTGTVRQFSKSDDVNTLTVNGQTGTVTPAVAGMGTSLMFQVYTGSPNYGWTCRVADDVEGNQAQWTAWEKAGTRFTPEGGSKGYLEISVPANVTKDDRDLVLIVERVSTPGLDPPDPVRIKLHQAKSKMLLSVFPYPQGGTLEIDGFINETRQENILTNFERTNSFSQQKDFFVSLSDPEEYYFKVETNFEANRDLLLTMTEKAPLTTKVNHNQKNMNQQFADKVHGERFFLNVYRMGPGDPKISGIVKITAYPKDPASGLDSQSISFDVVIKSGCIIGDCYIPNVGMVADRNVGALPRIDEKGDYQEALNFTKISSVKITGAKTQTDFSNRLFSGGYFTETDLNNAGQAAWVRDEFFYSNRDPHEYTSPFYTDDYKDSWNVPNDTELGNIWRALQWSKWRPYIVSELKSNGKYVGCYLPLAGTGDNSSGASPYNYGAFGYYRHYGTDGGYWGLSYFGYKPANDNANTLTKYGTDMNLKMSVRCILPTSKLPASEMTGILTSWYNRHKQ